MATLGGATALRMQDQVGSLEAGKQGDVMVLDVSGPHLAPNEELDPYATIVHAARATDVRLTMVSGRILYRDGSWATLDAERTAAESRAESRRLRGRLETGAAR